MAIDAPVTEAVRTLDRSPGTDLEARLSILINGWGRGLAAGLEELAIAVDDLRRRREPTVEGPASEPPEEPPDPEAPGAPQEEPPREEEDEDRLRERAARSRDATEALREESSQERRGPRRPGRPDAAAEGSGR
ncbi:MAG TPA: hypothetical protein VFA19_01345 [Gaiellaceae bacterium]|nr:hypothetical protein [Gaiellaceae bacterium]